MKTRSTSSPSAPPRRCRAKRSGRSAPGADRPGPPDAVGSAGGDRNGFAPDWRAPSAGPENASDHQSRAPGRRDLIGRPTGGTTRATSIPARRRGRFEVGWSPWNPYGRRGSERAKPGRVRATTWKVKADWRDPGESGSTWVGPASATAHSSRPRVTPPSFTSRVSTRPMIWSRSSRLSDRRVPRREPCSPDRSRVPRT